MVHTTPTSFDVGRAFVHQYYTVLHQAPKLLYRFYSSDSTFIHGGVNRSGQVEQIATGPAEISKRVNELNIRDCHAKIRQIDSHSTIGNGVVVQVTGELSNNGGPMRRFMQTFVLAPMQPKKYYVQNDIFRYQDEVFDDGSDEDDRSSSQVYGDMDKVSNADSSVAVTQPSSSVSDTARMAMEEHQPLPPRRTVPATTSHEPQSTSDSTSHQQDTNVSQSQSSEQQTTPTASAEQPKQQATKQVVTEGASYAGIAKLKSAGGAAVVPAVAPVNSIQSTESAVITPTPAAVRPASEKQTTNRPNNGQRPHTDNYRQHNRGYRWNDQPPNEYRANPNQSTAPNEQQVFVGSVPPNFTRETLVDCFSQFGTVLDVKLNNSPYDHKKNYGFVIFEDPIIASTVVGKQHVLYQGTRLNVEPKTQKSYSAGGGHHNGPQGNPRGNYPNRGGRGGNRPPYRNNGNNSRRGGGGGGNIQYRSDSGNFSTPEENKQDVPQS